MSRLRVGICGHGTWMRRYLLPGLRASGAEVLGVVARSQDRADEVAEALGVPRGYAEVEDLLASGVQAVVVASPPRLHLAHALPALRAHIPVLCEKPLGVNSVESAALVQAAGSTAAMTGFSLRWHPDLRRLRDYLHTGAIGAVRLLDLHYASSSGASPMSAWNWHHDRAEEPGGVLTDLGAHAIDFARWLVGNLSLSSVDAVTAIRTRVSSGSRGERRVTNPDVVALRLMASDAAVRVLCSRIHPQTPSGAGVSLTAFGEEGWVRWDAAADPPLLLARTGHQPVAEGQARDLATLVASELRDFLDLAAGGTAPADLPTLEDGHQAQLLIDEAITSIRDQADEAR